MRRTASLLLAVVVLFATLAQSQPALKILKTEVGFLRGESFEPNPTRVFSAEQLVALRVTLAAPAGLPVRFEAKLIHPLGPVVKSSSQLLEPPPRPSEWTLLLAFNLSGLPEGYYRFLLTAEAGGYRSEESVTFYYRGLVALVNTVEAQYGVSVEGEGEVETLLVALPNDPSLKLSGELLIFPKPASIVRDSFGNAYALYKNFRVRGSFKVIVSFTATQEVTYVGADAPLSTPLPAEVKKFLEPSPYIESNSPDTERLARELTAGAGTYREALARIADYTSTAIKYDEAVAYLPNYNQLGALWALHAKRGACLQFARLFTALARAAGIPARVVSGLYAKPLGLGGESSTHAYVEVYIPGYGWLPIEPQQQGSIVGLVPPVPGYLALVRGSGERVTIASEEQEAATFLIVYRGSLRTSITYAARTYPAVKPPAALQLRISAPQRAFFGDRLQLQLPQLPGGSCEVTVSTPSFTSTAKVRCGEPLELELNETGVWRLELFAWAPGYLPAYTSTETLVEPRPLRISLNITNNMLFRSAEITATTEPPVPRAPIRFAVRTCYYSEELTAATDDNGVARIFTRPLLLPCRLEVSASAAPQGYAEAESSLAAQVGVPAELYLAAAAIIVAAAFARSRRKPLPALG